MLEIERKCYSFFKLNFIAWNWGKTKVKPRRSIFQSYNVCLFKNKIDLDSQVEVGSDDNDDADKEVMGHLSSPLKNQMDILHTLSVCDWCPTWMYSLGVVNFMDHVLKVKCYLLILVRLLTARWTMLRQMICKVQHYVNAAGCWMTLCQLLHTPHFPSLHSSPPDFSADRQQWLLLKACVGVVSQSSKNTRFPCFSQSQAVSHWDVHNLFQFNQNQKYDSHGSKNYHRNTVVWEFDIRTKNGQIHIYLLFTSLPSHPSLPLSSTCPVCNSSDSCYALWSTWTRLEQQCPCDFF